MINTRHICSPNGAGDWVYSLRVEGSVYVEGIGFLELEYALLAMTHSSIVFIEPQNKPAVVSMKRLKKMIACTVTDVRVKAIRD